MVRSLQNSSRYLPSLQKCTRNLATIARDSQRVPQTYIEKVVQKYATDLPEGKVVKAGDYVMIRPEHVMSHDNTGPIITKYVSSMCIC